MCATRAPQNKEGKISAPNRFVNRIPNEKKTFPTLSESLIDARNIIRINIWPAWLLCSPLSLIHIADTCEIREGKAEKTSASEFRVRVMRATSFYSIHKSQCQFALVSREPSSSTSRLATGALKASQNTLIKQSWSLLAGIYAIKAEKVY